MPLDAPQVMIAVSGAAVALAPKVASGARTTIATMVDPTLSSARARWGQIVRTVVSGAWAHGMSDDTS